jgi:NCS1 family nucleobase:cation symporter-1
MRAVFTFVVTSAPSIVVAVVPWEWCKFLSAFSWFIGAGLAFAIHYLVSRNDPFIARALEAAARVDLDADRDAVAR